MVVVAPAGPPDVIAMGISNVLKQEIISSTVFMAITGDSIGSLMCHIIVHGPAPSIAAASVSDAPMF